MKTKSVLAHFCAWLVVVAATSTNSWAESEDTTATRSAPAWTGFRGDGTNRASDGNLPTEWSPAKNIAWKIDLPGYGQSAPVVWGDQAFVTSVEGPNKEKCIVSAHDLASGKQRWLHRFDAGTTQKASNMVSRAAPTPCVDAAGVYAFFESGDLLKLTHAGKVQWKRSLTGEYGKFDVGHGIGSSPAQTDQAVIVLADHGGPSYLLAVDKNTGKNLWKADRKSRVSWSSPAIASRGNRQEVIVSSNGSVDGYDARTGEQLWSFDDVAGNTVASATVVGDRVLVGASAGRQDPDAGSAARSNCCLKLVEKEGKRTFEVAWRARQASSSFASPLIHGKYAYFINKVGVVYCLDVETGEQHYAERLKGSCWATPLGVGNRVYFFGTDGTTTVLESGPAFKKLAVNQLWTEEEARKFSSAEEGKEGQDGYGRSIDPVVYGVAVADGAFLVRSGTQLFRVGSR